MNSEQLLLKLGMPWDGISPRYLTRAPKRRILTGTGRPDLQIFWRDPFQLELFPEGTHYGT